MKHLSQALLGVVLLLLGGDGVMEAGCRPVADPRSWVAQNCRGLKAAKAFVTSPFGRGDVVVLLLLGGGDGVTEAGCCWVAWDSGARGLNGCWETVLFPGETGKGYASFAVAPNGSR